MQYQPKDKGVGSREWAVGTKEERFLDFVFNSAICKSAFIDFYTMSEQRGGCFSYPFAEINARSLIFRLVVGNNILTQYF